ncbi:hypothetical protein [Lutimonas zeaxanthinifaciens]|uniref:hypothetical protein n=1 Tax=Lutimonas zeaxanthinifaciens TaxID=3060215 RepID=UPI00265C95F5|nr:hypothetical protein [Lutimonas sp. YSD2104]WKK67269.1 hypothetical protein QZH61_06500 [Lutimonas sp. YSD2104]
MGRKNKFTRRSVLPILGSSFLLPFMGKAKVLESENIEDESFEILIKPDGTPVKVKKSSLKNAKVLEKKISNKGFMSWLGKKL